MYNSIFRTYDSKKYAVNEVPHDNGIQHAKVKSIFWFDSWNPLIFNRSQIDSNHQIGKCVNFEIVKWFRTATSFLIPCVENVLIPSVRILFYYRSLKLQFLDDEPDCLRKSIVQSISNSIERFQHIFLWRLAIKCSWDRKSSLISDVICSKNVTTPQRRISNRWFTNLFEKNCSWQPEKMYKFVRNYGHKGTLKCKIYF